MPSRDLQSIQNADVQLAKVDQLLTAEAADAVDDVLDELQSDFDQARTSTLNRLVALLNAELGSLRIPDAKKADFDKAKSGLAEVETLLQQQKLDDAWRKCSNVAELVKGLRTAMPLRTGEPEPGQAFRGNGVEAETRLVATEPPDARTTDAPVGFKIQDEEHLLQRGDEYRWYFESSQPATTNVPAESHSFASEGAYRVKVEVWRGTDSGPVVQLSLPVTVLPGRTQSKLNTVWKAVLVTEMVPTVVALILACLTGILYLYVNKAFGTLADYLGALLWGFGIDSGVRGYAAVFKRITTPAT
jgi:hypothetical protein